MSWNDKIIEFMRKSNCQEVKLKEILSSDVFFGKISSIKLNIEIDKLVNQNDIIVLSRGHFKLHEKHCTNIVLPSDEENETISIEELKTPKKKRNKINDDDNILMKPEKLRQKSKSDIHTRLEKSKVISLHDHVHLYGKDHHIYLGTPAQLK